MHALGAKAPADWYLPENASHVERIEPDESMPGVWALTYDIDARYPAAEYLESLHQHLSARGWCALSHDFDFPDLPTGRRRGWNERIGGDPIDMWIGYWAGKNGDVQHVRVMYDSGPNRGKRGGHVVINYIEPVAAGEALRNYKRHHDTSSELDCKGASP